MAAAVAVAAAAVAVAVLLVPARAGAVTPLDREYDNRRLLRPGAVMKRLAIDGEALRLLVAHHELAEATFEWKGKRMRGYTRADIRGKRVVYRDGRVRLMPEDPP